MDPPGPFAIPLLGALFTLSPRMSFPRLRATFVQANSFLLGLASPISISSSLSDPFESSEFASVPSSNCTLGLGVEDVSSFSNRLLLRGTLHLHLTISATGSKNATHLNNRLSHHKPYTWAMDPPAISSDRTIEVRREYAAILGRVAALISFV
jgi:hypothetical protein